MAAIREPMNSGVEGLLSIVAVLYVILSIVSALVLFMSGSTLGAVVAFAQGVLFYAMFAAASQALKHLRHIRATSRASLELLAAGRALFVCGACGHVAGQRGQCPSCDAGLREQSQVGVALPPAEHVTA